MGSRLFLDKASYRVWVEKREAGWVTVKAASADLARDVARDRVERELWGLGPTSIDTCEVELVRETPKAEVVR